jgi:hypothetical protein
MAKDERREESTLREKSQSGQLMSTVLLVGSNAHSQNSGEPVWNVCPVCGWLPDEGLVGNFVPIHTARRGGGRCHGSEQRAVRAVTPKWVQPGGYAPAFGGGKKMQRGQYPDKPSTSSVPAPERKRITPPPRSAQPILDIVPTVAQLSNAATPELFTRITTYGLRLPPGGKVGKDFVIAQVAEEILACKYQIAVVSAVNPASSSWTKKCVRPPFQKQWIEYHFLDMLCGALITEVSSDVFNFQFVTATKRERARPLLWSGPEKAKLAADGSLAQRTSAIADSRNFVVKPEVETLVSIFNSVYPQLAIINMIHDRNREESGARDGPREVLPSQTHELGAVVLVWGDESAIEFGAPLATPRHAPAGHSVRGHERHLRDGTVIWVNAHHRGGNRTDPAKPRVYHVRRR